MNRPLLAAFAAAGVLAGGSPLPSQERPRFGVSADLVVLDLVAWDKDGRFVADLRPEEVEVYEDGKRQKLEFLHLAATPADRPAAPASPAETVAQPLTPTPPATAPAPSPPASTLSLVVVVDLMTMHSEVLARTKQAIVRMARTEIEPGTRLMLATVSRGMQVRQPFNADIDRFVAAVEALSPGPGEDEASVFTLVDEVDEACSAMSGTPAFGTPGGLQSVVNISRAWVENVRLGMSASLEGLGALSRYLASIPGRKHVVFYSAGYPLEPVTLTAGVLEELCLTQGSAGRPDDRGRAELQSSVSMHQKVDSAGMLQAFFDEANRAQVSVYTVDARGLVGDVTPARSRMPAAVARSGVAQQVTQRAVRAPQEFLSSVADNTGGTSSLNSNELALGMRAAATDARAYYLVAYAPAGSRKEGRFYPVTVKVRREGVRVRYRKGYEWLTDTRRAERAVAAALRFPTLYAEEGLTVAAAVEGGRLRVSALLPTAALAFRQAGPEYLDEIALYALLRDAAGRPVGERYLFAKTIAMKLTASRYADLRTRDNVEVPTEVDLPKPGRYSVTVVARHSGGRLASATAEIDIP